MCMFFGMERFTLNALCQCLVYKFACMLPCVNVGEVPCRKRDAKIGQVWIFIMASSASVIIKNYMHNITASVKSLVADSDELMVLFCVWKIKPA